MRVKLGIIQDLISGFRAALALVSAVTRFPSLLLRGRLADEMRPSLHELQFC